MNQTAYAEPHYGQNSNAEVFFQKVEWTEVCITLFPKSKHYQLSFRLLLAESDRSTAV